MGYPAPQCAGDAVLARLAFLLFVPQGPPLRVEFEQPIDIDRDTFAFAAEPESLWVFTESLEVDHGSRV